MNQTQNIIWLYKRRRFHSMSRNFIFCKSFSVCVLNSKQKSQSLCTDNHKKKTKSMTFIYLFFFIFFSPKSFQSNQFIMFTLMMSHCFTYVFSLSIDCCSCIDLPIHVFTLNIFRRF